MIIAVLQTKGGVGKSTLAVNLAVERALHAKRNVLLVDADEQGTASDFVAIRAERLGSAGFSAIQLHGAAVRGEVLAKREKYDDIIIDCGGRDTAALRAALTVAERALVPFQPRSFDVWTIDKVGALVAEAKTLNPALKAFAVINCADSQGSDNQAAAAALAENPHITYLDTPLVRRKAFPNSNAIGLSVLEANPADHKARDELIRLVDALISADPTNLKR